VLPTFRDFPQISSEAEMDHPAVDFTNMAPTGGTADTTLRSPHAGQGVPARPAQDGADEWLSFADALAFVDAPSGLSKTAQRDLRSALVSAAKLMRRQPRDLPFTPAAISDSVLGHMPKLWEVKVQRRRNILSGLRKVARLMGVIPEPQPGLTCLTPHWSALTDGLGADYARHGMTRFIRFCSDRGLVPWEVSSAVFSDFAEALRHTVISRNRTGYLSHVMSGWNRLARQKPELKLQRLVGPRNKPALTIPLDQFPAEFQLELAQFRAALSPVDIGALHDDLDLPPEQARFRPSGPLKPGTVNLRMAQLGYAAGALVHSGWSPHSLTSLRDLFTPVSNAKTIIRHLRARGTAQRSSYAAGVVEALCQAARFCQADPAILAELEHLTAVVSPQQQGVVPKNRDRLRAMIEPGTRAIILALPELLVDSAKKTDCPREAARRVRVAVALELLITAAPRLDNLHLLDIDTSFRRAASGKHRITHMIVDALDVKNGVPIERALPATTMGLLQLWLDEYRPRLAKPGCPWLFPGNTAKPLCKSRLRTWISRAIRDYANVEVHPHLFRHFCAWLHLQYHPGDYEGVRRLLGHKRIETAIKSYIAFEQDVAAARYDKAVLKERQASRLMVKAALNLRPGNARRRGKETGHAQNH
jgi:integrase